jgi:hypothetical protein
MISPYDFADHLLMIELTSALVKDEAGGATGSDDLNVGSATSDTGATGATGGALGVVSVGWATGVSSSVSW